MMTSSKKLRWGFLSTARINEKILKSLSESRFSVASAIASREVDKARSYAEQWSIPKFYGSYEELLESPDVDVVYVSLPNHLHTKWTLKAVKCGKHVLCEKPLGLKSLEIVNIERESLARNLVVTEGFMYRHHLQSQAIKDLLVKGRLGSLQHMKASFNINLSADQNIRLDPAAGGGSLWDVGCYIVDLMQYVAGAGATEVFAWAQNSELGVDERFVGNLRFASGVTASFDCGFRGPRMERLELIGTQAWLDVERPFKPQEREKLLLLSKDSRSSIEIEDSVSAYTRQILDFEAAIIERRPPMLSLSHSRSTIATLEALQESARSRRPVPVQQ